MFSPIRTERLLVRHFRAGDAVGLVRRRNDPKVARYQDWVVPYSTAQGEEMVAHLAAMEGPESDEWWMAIVCDPETDEVFGDLALHLTSGSRTAEVGYTFASEHWGKGYATESLAALIEYLFKTLDVTRVFGCYTPTTRPRRWCWSGAASCSRAIRGRRSGWAMSAPMTGSMASPGLIGRPGAIGPATHRLR